MALFKNYVITLDTMRTPNIALQNIVAGETGCKLTVTLTNNGSNVSLNGTDHRVCLRVDSSKGTRRQDSSLTGSGISFNNGKAIIKLSRDSYTSGRNRARLEIYSTETTANDTLICSAEFTFTAKCNPTGENAGAIYPSLIKAEQDAAAATTAANNAASSANSAASAVNTLMNKLPYVLTVTQVGESASYGIPISVSDTYDDIVALKTNGVFRTIEFVASIPNEGYLVFREMWCGGNIFSDGHNLYIEFDAVGVNHQKRFKATLNATYIVVGSSELKSVSIFVNEVSEAPLIINLKNATWDGYDFSGTADDNVALSEVAFQSSGVFRPVMLWVESPDTPGEFCMLMERRRSGGSSIRTIYLMSGFDNYDSTYAEAEIDVYPAGDTQHTTTITGKWFEI